MATKYVRKTTDRAGRHQGPPAGPFDMLRRMQPKRRLILIYVGVSAMSLLILLGDRFFVGSQFGGQPLIRGEGVVVTKHLREAEVPTYTLAIEVLTDAGTKTYPCHTQTDSETWNRLQEGDRVAVVYQFDRGKTRVRIREVGTVAFRGPIR